MRDPINKQYDPINKQYAFEDGLRISQASTDNKRPYDWRHNSHDYLIPIGRDIFYSNLTIAEITKKWGVSRSFIKRLSKKLFYKKWKRVRAGSNRYIWREKKEFMKVKLEVTLRDQVFSASDLILALSKTVQQLNGANGNGPVMNRNNVEIGKWEVTDKDGE